MKTIRVKDIYDNEVTYEGCKNDKCKKGRREDGQPKCDCSQGFEPRKFTSYKALAEDGKYYRLSGSGTASVQAGDEISGELTSEAWESDGKSGMNYDLKLPNKEDKLQSENERLKAELIEAKGGGNDAPPHTDEDIPY